MNFGDGDRAIEAIALENWLQKRRQKSRREVLVRIDPHSKK
jgi:hypothetical protein